MIMVAMTTYLANLQQQGHSVMMATLLHSEIHHHICTFALLPMAAPSQ